MAALAFPNPVHYSLSNNFDLVDQLWIGLGGAGVAGAFVDGRPIGVTYFFTCQSRVQEQFAKAVNS